MKKITFLFLMTLLPLMTNAQILIGFLYYNIDKSTKQATLAYAHKSLGSVLKIPETITYDGITYSVTTIESNALSSHPGLISVTIPNTVTTIGYGAFYDCYNLTSVTIPNSVTSINAYTFRWCSALTSVTIPTSVTSIGYGAFLDCSSLTSIDIPNNVTSIGGSAFMNCKKITSVTIPNSVTSIGNGAFAGCSALSSVTIGNSVTTIGDDAFASCPNLTRVFLNSNTVVSTTYSNDFNLWDVFGSHVKEYILGEDVTSIGDNAFHGCTSLKSVTIGNSVTSIGDFAFNGCWRLTSVTIPNSVISIGNHAFGRCSDLDSVTIGNSVSSIGNYAFFDCSDLTSITIPYSVTSIGKEAFWNCSNLDSVIVLPEIPPFLYDNSFSFYSVPLKVPKGCKEAYQHAQGWKNFTNISDADKYKLTYVVDGDEYKSYEIEEGTSITPEPELAKEGYTFSGWSEIPETMPAHNVTVKGTFSINKYRLTYTVDDEEYKSYEIDYGASITPEPAPTKQDYTFSGWSEIPETMPAHDVTVTGSYTKGSYTLTYMVDGEVYKTISYDYGAAITPEPAPTREGYTFSGWSEKVETMPAHDVIVTGTFTPNKEDTGVDYVDLGLPSGLLWATCNIGAENPEEYGTYFDWIKNPVQESWDDVWRTPTKSERDELVKYCTYSVDTVNGVKGARYTGVNGQSVFFPFAGYKQNDRGPYNVGIGGQYWTCTKYDDGGYWILGTDKSVQKDDNAYYWPRTYFSFPVRPVTSGTHTVETSDIIINEENFPDENFRAFLKEQHYGEDGVLTEEEIHSITTMSISNPIIKSLKGIEFFTALVYLDCSGIQLTSLDVSKNTALTKLYINTTQLTSLDVSKNTALKCLQCGFNQLTSLDMSKNTALEELICNNNQLTSLNVSGCIALADLFCPNNQLTSLDVSKNTALAELDCCGNQLTSLDVSKNTALEVLNCNVNQLTSLDVSKCTALTDLTCRDNQLTSLDVSNNTALEVLNCYNNLLTNLDVSKNTALIGLDCRDNQLTSLNVSKNTALMELYCNNNQLTSLDVSKNTALTRLYCYGNKIKEEAMDVLVGSLPIRSSAEIRVVDLSNTSEENVCTTIQVNVAKEKGWKVLTSSGDDYEGSDPAGNVIIINEDNFPDENFRAFLKEQWYGQDDILTDEEINSITVIEVNNKNIKSLEGIEFFTALDSLYCASNQLTSLDVSKNTALMELDCYENQLTSLDVSQNTALTTLRCSDNQLSSLDVSTNTALTSLNCGYNQLTSLDVSKCTALTFLHCDYNQLSSLDVSKNTALKRLNSDYNQLTSLDLSKNVTLTDLNCIDNQLTSLDVSKNTALTWLSCGENQLTSLDVSKNVALTCLDCHSIQLTSLDVSKNIALKELRCYWNKLTSLDVSNNTALQRLQCSGNKLTNLDISNNSALQYLICNANQLTYLDVSNNTNLNELSIYGNIINEESMDVLVKGLPQRTQQSYARLGVVDLTIESEGNVCTTAQVAMAKERGWNVLAYTGNYRWTDYGGSEPSGIHVFTLDKNANVPIYDLNGRRLKEPNKGVNIIDGKTVVVK